MGVVHRGGGGLAGRPSHLVAWGGGWWLGERRGRCRRRAGWLAAGPMRPPRRSPPNLRGSRTRRGSPRSRRQPPRHRTSTPPPATRARGTSALPVALGAARGAVAAGPAPARASPARPPPPPTLVLYEGKRRSAAGAGSRGILLAAAAAVVAPGAPSWRRPPPPPPPPPAPRLADNRCDPAGGGGVAHCADVSRRKVGSVWPPDARDRVRRPRRRRVPSRVAGGRGRWVGAPAGGLSACTFKLADPIVLVGQPRLCVVVCVPSR